ncbi:unnamed protein product, partial [Hymenolepis diminuta]|uniref:PX domain-containing protein n=1 Tax=Hymenolepis diminuta TaxID=6216 RepID=A0A0R3SIC7_HYMDI
KPLVSALRADSCAALPSEDSNTPTTRLRHRSSLPSLISLGGLGAPDESHYEEWSAAIRLAGSLSIGCSGAATPETIRRVAVLSLKEETNERFIQHIVDIHGRLPEMSPTENLRLVYLLPQPSVYRWILPTKPFEHFRCILHTFIRHLGMSLPLLVGEMKQWVWEMDELQDIIPAVEKFMQPDDLR